MSERSEEDWGRVAVSLPGWRWVPGMHDCWGRCAVSDAAGGVRWVNPFNPADQHEPDHWPDPDDPATAGCLLALLGPGGSVRHDTHRGDDPGCHTAWWSGPGRGDGPTPGRAIVALAEQLGQWPGGDPDTLPELWMTPEGPMSGREKLVSMATFITSEGGDGAAWLALCERVS